YSIPNDNPFLDLPGARPEIWAYGFRNPWKMTFDRKTGQLWVGSNGQDVWEFVHLVRRGENYGWAHTEGGRPFRPDRPRGPHPVTPPVTEHPHSEARSLTGGLVYYGKKHPELTGVYIYGDYSTGRIWGVKHDGAKIVYFKELADTSLAISGFGSDHDGEVYVIDYRTGVYAFEPTPPEAAVANKNFPRTLSATGLYADVAKHLMHPAVIPYSVNSPLWSDGAHKDRFIALPESSAIDYTAGRGWNFPEGSVLVKTFSLDVKAGDATSRRRVETRLMAKTQGEWEGYSYLWNDEQTDAVLVDKAGADREYSVGDATAPDGVRKQVWHYPSRTECMVCHTRATNYVLGLCHLQMNRDHDYGGVVDNQLRALEHVGALKMAEADKKRIGDEKDKLVNPMDAGQPLEARVKSYLHSNCAVCHVAAGGGNARMELEFTTPLDKMVVVDVKPQHSDFGIADARIVAPGS
ncbi:MAG: PQQ-dependent sugar dehydrogenase, partial [Planctomycetia bacterium]